MAGSKWIYCKFCDAHWEVPDDWDSPNPEICVVCRLERGMYKVVNDKVIFDKSHDAEVLK